MSNAKTLPQNLTSYDILKSLAMLLVVVDHIGVYFYPDVWEWRWVGRLAAPIWLFLIGYASSRAVPWQLFAGAGLLQSMKLLVNADFWALDILFSIVVIRIMLDPLMGFARRSVFHMVGLVAVLLVLAVPAQAYVMYGTIGLMMAMFGALVKGKASPRYLMIFGGTLVLAYISVIMINHDFSMLAGQVLLCAMAGLFWGLSRFAPCELSKATEKLPRPLTVLLKIGGRHSLVFYVLHLILFMSIAAALKIAHYHFI